ncbi:MAG: addiction module protein [Candidatus Polarisedimenticolaceae bacterium]|nr:addiction module protein [Candidatus Polarisedimenticolaceae bacterium]
MSAAFNQVIESIRELSSDERALVAHCLISSLESKQDDGVDEAWAKLAEKRYCELESGAVKGISWQEIKNRVKG